MAVSFQNKPWKAVLEWLSEEARLPVIAQQVPTGTFTCVSPAGKSYSLPEVIDLMSEALMASKFRLHRGPASVLLLPADERPDPALVSTVRPEDLPARGRTEVVRVVLSLKTLKAQDLVPEVKKLLGPFGEAGTLANRLVLQDTVQNLRQILKTLQELEAQAPPAPAAAGSAAPALRVYPVRSEKAESLARMLQDVYRNVPGVRITATSLQTIVVRGSPSDQDQVANLLRLLDVPLAPPTTELIPLASLPAVRTVETLKAMFGGPGGPYLEADATRNALIVRGARPQIEDVRSALRALGDAPAARTMRTITLERGSALALAEALQNQLRQMRPNPVRVIAPGQPNAPAVRAPAKGTDKPLPPLTLVPVGNKLIASCEDTQVLALVEELVRVLTQAGGEGELTVIRLRSGNAVEVAKVLTDTFNGPAGAKGPERVRIVADPTANALLVRASPLDLLTIRHLLRTALDSEREDVEAAARTWIIGPLKHAEAAELAKVLTAVYRGEAGRTGFVVTADQRTNTLVLRCTQPVFQDAKRLVDQLDAKAQEKVK